MTPPARREEPGLPPSASRPLLLAIVAVLLVLAGLRLPPGYDSLLFAAPAQRSESRYIAVGHGATDLVSRRLETEDFFSGRRRGGRVYPPATYAMLWPFIASGSLEAARWIWAAVLTVSLAWLCGISAHASGFADPLARLAMGLVPLGCIATSSALGTGQLTLPVLALMTAAVLRLARSPRTRGDDATTAALFTLASVKPTLVAPVGWLLLVLPRSIVPAGLAAFFYASVTGIAFALRGRIGTPLPVVPRPPGAGPRPPLFIEENMFAFGYANLQNWLVHLGIGFPWVILPPVLGLVLLGWWTWRHRDVDPWLLLAVACLVARLCFYHRLYDDLLVLPVLVALARLASGATAPSPVAGPVQVADPGDATAEIRAASLWTLVAVAGSLLAPASLPVAARHAVATGAWVAALVLLVRAPAHAPPLQIRAGSLTPRLDSTSPGP